MEGYVYVPPSFVEIPIKDSDENEVLRIDGVELPSTDDIVQILQQEGSHVDIWLKIALLYHYNGEYEKYELIAEKCVQEKAVGMMTNAIDAKALYRLYSSLGAHYAQKGSRELKMENKTKCFEKSATWYNMSEGLAGFKTTINNNIDHVVRRAFLHLRHGSQGAYDHANIHFNFALTLNSYHAPALVGKATMAFKEKDYHGALEYYRKVLQYAPCSGINVRVGIGHCFWKLGSWDRAEEAFQRAVDVDPENVQALCALAICYLRKKEKMLTSKGVVLLARAYSIDRDNAAVLIYLANHFFYKKEFDQAKELAYQAFHGTNMDLIKSHAAFHIARIHHVSNDRKLAFQFYYSASKSRLPSVLSQFGLGQIYFADGDNESAIKCFQEVLAVINDHSQTLKMLGSIFAHSLNEAERLQASDLLLQVVKLEPENHETWMELALAKERNDPLTALEYYEKALKISKNNGKMVSPQICNNIGVLHLRLNQLKMAKQYFEKALMKCKTNSEIDAFRKMEVTIRFNIGRALEQMSEFVEAEKIYKMILKEYPSYYSCFLRLGIMSRDKQLPHEALNYFKEALQASGQNPDVWCLIGNMHISYHETTPAMKKFALVLEMKPETQYDPFSYIALGNIELQYMNSARNEESFYGHGERAMKFFMRVLHKDRRNAFAANGIGCSLAYQGHINEANDIFSLVREGTADFQDVWVNIANTYMEQKTYISAIQMYENCLKKFHKNYNTEILQCIAKAQLKNGNLTSAKLSLLKCLRANPEDQAVIFSLAKVLQKLSWETLRNEKATLYKALGAAKDLAIAMKYFRYISSNPMRNKCLIEAGNVEAQYCQDLITQAQYHIGRARRSDTEERLQRQKKEEEFEVHRLKLTEAKKNEDERQRLDTEIMHRKREEFVEQMKGAMSFAVEEPVEIKPEKDIVTKKRGRKKKMEELLPSLTDTCSSDEVTIKKSKAKKPKKLRKRKKSKKKNETSN